jgi:integrase
VPGLGHLRLARLHPEHVEQFLAAKQQEGLSPRSCQYLRAILRIALNRAVKHGLVFRNVAALAEPPRVTRADVQTLTPEQARVFLETQQDRRLYPVIVVAVSCGLRSGEILGLRWEDVDLERGVLRVRHTLERLGGGWRLLEPKSETSRRTIRVPEPVIPILRAHRVKQLERRLLAGPDWQEYDFVFTTRTGQPLEGVRLNRDTKSLLRRAGLPAVHFHALRHSCATFLLAQGVAPRVVMDVLGHSDIRLTLNTYSHVLEQMQDGAAHEMASVLWPAQKSDRECVS